MAGVTDTVAVVTAGKSDFAVWWVALDAGSAMGRLCGAWVLSKGEKRTLRTLVAQRLLLPTNAGTKALKSADCFDGQRVIDANRILADAIGSRDRLQAAFEEERASRPRSKKLVPPTWPSFPKRLDLAGIAKAEREEPGAAALAIARWLTTVLDRWSDLEEQRLSRRWLAAIDGTKERRVPIALVEAG